MMEELNIQPLKNDIHFEEKPSKAEQISCIQTPSLWDSICSAFCCIGREEKKRETVLAPINRRRLPIIFTEKYETQLSEEK